MIEPFLGFLWMIWVLWIVVAVAATFTVLTFNRARKKQDEALSGVTPEQQKRVALIVSIKGFDEKETTRFFESVLTQDYENYRVIVTMESEAEPVASWLREQLEMGEEDTKWSPESVSRGLHQIQLVFAGESVDCGQKVHNQLKAFELLNDDDVIVAFADADIQCEKDWLSRLVAPINKGLNEASTTYRWLIPRKHSFPNLLGSVINASVATQIGKDQYNFLWGGSMALTRELFNELEVPKNFKGALNDDLRLSKLMRTTGRRPAAVRSLLMPSPVSFTWGSLFEFGRRQYFQVRHNTPILFIGANFILLTYVLGLVTALLAATVGGYFFAWIPIVIVTVLDQLRAYGRARIIDGLFKGPARRILEDTISFEHLFTPLWMTIHALMALSSCFIDTVTWAGITYQVKGPNDTKILGRRDLS